MSKLTNNYCYLCDWTAPSEPNLREHLLHCHPGKKNKPVVPEKQDKDWIYMEHVQDIDYKGYDWIKGDPNV